MDSKKPPSGLLDTDLAVADTHASEPGATMEPATVREGPPKGPRQVRSGDSLGRYDLLEEIGEGGMASVFRARDTELRRDVAVKVLFPHLARRDEVVRRFHREARAAANLEHPNILRIYDVGGGEGDDPPFIVMELIRGRTLLEEIEQRGPVFAEVTACIGALLADALSAAHAKGIIHRDIKPSNVLIAQGGRLLLADFGVARLETEDSSLVTRTGALLGTPAYMSPEQASGDTATVRSDLYSLGATLYQLATGMLPYSGSPAKVLSLIATGAMVAPVKRRAEVGPDLSHAITRMMAVDPTERPQTATSIAVELRAIAATSGFGDATEELSAYFDNAEKFLDDKRPQVVSAIVSAGKQAIAESKLPRAMALADRASALAPEDPAVKTLVETVTEGDRGARRRKLVALGAIGLLVLGGGAVGIAKLAGGGSATPDAAQVALADTAIVVDSGPPDQPTALDAAPEPDAVQLLEDARVQVARDAALAKRDAAVAVAPPDVAVEPPDAPAVTLPPDAPIVVEDGSIVVSSDSWCAVSVDGVKRADLKGAGQAVTIKLSAGPHTVLCEKPGIDPGWTKTITVEGGKQQVVTGTSLKQVNVTIAITTGDRIEIAGRSVARGSKTQLKASRYTATVWSGDKRGITGFFDVRLDCRIHEVGTGLVCDATP